MAYPPITDHWEEIHQLAVQGVPIPTLAVKFGLKEKSIYNKCAAEDWQTPKKLRAKLEQMSRERQKVYTSDPLLGGLSPSEFSESVLLETWETRAASLRNLSYDVAVRAIKEAKGQIVIESASDLKHAVHVARQATGLLDTEAPAIQFSMFANSDICGPSVMESQPIDVEPLQNDAEISGFWE